MTLLLAHEVGFAASMACGMLGLLLGRELPDVCFLFLLVVPLSAWQALAHKALPTPVGAALGALSCLWAGMLYAAGGDGAALKAAALVLLGILTARLVTRTFPSHDLQALVLSLLLMFAGTLLHQAFTFALVLVVYTVAATWALLTRQLIAGCTEAFFRDGNRAAWQASLARTDVVTVRFGLTVAALAWCILLATGVLFVLFPRVGMGGMHLGGSTQLLPDSISLGGTPRAQGTDQVVVRLRGISAQAADAGLYLRGRVYDELRKDGFGQLGQKSQMGRVKPSHMRLFTEGRPSTYMLELEQIDGVHLLALGPVEHVERPRGADLFGAGAPGEVAVQAPSSELIALGTLQGPQRLQITGYNVPLRAAASRPAGDELEDMEPSFSARFLQLPEHLDPSVTALAQSVVGNTPRFSDRALKLRQFLLQQFTYTLQQPNARAPDPLHSFLFVDRRGHCEFFAVAFAVLLRAVGVPSRVVGGYQGGTWDAADHTVLFSGRNAHAWVEWYLPGRGWVVDDATPPSDVMPLSAWGQWLEQARTVWEDTIMQFGLTEQLALLKGMTTSLGHATSAVSHVRHLGTLGRMPLPKQAATVAGVIACMVGFAFLWTRLARRRRGPKLSRALVAALERLAGAPLPASAGCAEALQLLQDQQRLPSLAAQELLEEAMAVYLSYRFGALGPVPKTARLCRRLRSLRPKVDAPRGF